ncbi:hypothetical protein MRX96_019918 [Rhipicephalus microplus]
MSLTPSPHYAATVATPSDLTPECESLGYRLCPHLHAFEATVELRPWNTRQQLPRSNVWLSRRSFSWYHV